ncbi:Gfo/Idh/MocA family oxidoreductase [Candidatus Peregrinibacteria bacterium]|nr:Gfo/Idh/MocA family oxidoreductase [Candidatus Peregrinibacteria bacterium]MBI5733013.1 Gfo/Idh/MocA family oxidoreductase [Candidatus Jorgensenbacteria bacterium]
MGKIINVGIVGAGLIGNKRALAIRVVRGARLVAVADAAYVRAKDFGAVHHCEVMRRWQDLVRRDDIDVVIVAVPNKFIVPIVTTALAHKKHILCEKPFGRTSRESLQMLKAARRYHRLVMVGFNHRFHGAIAKAKQLVDRGYIGKLLFIRARYGHGGRLGMEKEWRFNKKISGGGELLDQGIHIIDLCRWFVGSDFKNVYGKCETKFWKTKLEDNAFVLMKGKNVTVSFHVSTTNWKNIFSFEIFGDWGFLVIEGKGGSYGEEKLIVGKRRIKFGQPITKKIVFSRDVSWEAEWTNFLSALKGKSKIIGDAIDGFKANQIVEAIYKSSRLGKPIKAN